MRILQAECFSGPLANSTLMGLENGIQQYKNIPFLSRYYHRQLLTDVDHGVYMYAGSNASLG